jgi:hypothetical protein
MSVTVGSEGVRSYGDRGDDLIGVNGGARRGFNERKD